MKRSILSLAFAGSLALVASQVMADVVFQDSFTYSTGNLVGQGGWLQTGTVATNPIQVTANGDVALGTAGQDIYAPFTSSVSTSVSSGIVLDFDLTVNAAQAGGDYFIHLNNSATSSYFYERIFAKSGTAAGTFALGLLGTAGGTGGVTTPSYGADLTIGQKYHVAVAWNFVSGDKNDTFSIYINPSDPVLTNNTTYFTHTWGSVSSEPATLATVNLRQGSAANSATATIDNITVTSVPEPTSLALLGVAGLIAMRRRPRA